MTKEQSSMKSITGYFRAKPLRVVFAILWLIFVCLIITSGFSPNPYALSTDGSPKPHTYAIESVIILMIAMIVHISLLVIMDVYMRSGWKYLLMLMTTALFLICFGMMAIHAPPSLVWMITWTFLSFILFLILCFHRVFLFVLRQSFNRK